ncbi:hypothetical protein PDESU_06190 [Pontiella desulfatans]|uniref:Helix-turn-helix domain-containing protein n=1 Tax=Pontiella desulfatans TaxID=2750659 RepID=A0A6C2UBP7_PONDE|nr:helix-turn-helix domain-containing protein [Pontiella desulfatans]VGO17592.1 hypothetical protein PDESU_06190 [Pontiella desulfatans]
MESKIPESTLSMAVGMLMPYRPDLTPERLLAAIDFEPETEVVESLYTVPEAAKALSLSVPTINRMMRDGQLPKRKIRGAVRVPRSAIADILAGKEAAA